MNTVALVVHHERARAVELAREAVAWLDERGHGVCLPADDADAIGLPERGAGPEELAKRADVVVAVGGDGTMLRAVALVADHEVPVMGVNVGQLGYLTEVEPTHWTEALERVLAGDHAVHRRMLLSVRVERARPTGSRDGDHLALNEAVVEKTPMGHTVRLAVHIDGKFFTTYAADGLIVATPTGSTAYAFSARGPIVAPGHRALVLTPVSPHMLFDRTLVLEPSAELVLEVRGDRRATLSVDGRNLGELADGDRVICTASDRSARLVTFGDRDFHAILKAKFGLEDR